MMARDERLTGSWRGQTVRSGRVRRPLSGISSCLLTVRADSACSIRDEFSVGDGKDLVEELSDPDGGKRCLRACQCPVSYIGDSAVTGCKVRRCWLALCVLQHSWTN